MKIKNCFELAIKNMLKNKANSIILSVIIIIFFLIIGIYFSIIKSSGSYISTITNKDVGMRTIRVNVYGNRSELYNSLASQNLEHVVRIYKYNNDTAKVVKSDDFPEKDGFKAGFQLSGIYQGMDMNIVQGRMPKNDWEMICSNMFYPYQITDNIDANEIINLNNSLNKNIQISYTQKYYNKNYVVHSSLENNPNVKINSIYNHSIKIVGIYDSNDTFDPLSSCFTTPNTFDSLISENDIWEDENLKDKQYDHSPISVQVDKYENLVETRNELINLGYDLQSSTTIDDDFYNFSMTYNKYVLAMLVIIITVILLLLFNNYYYKNGYNIALYKALGFRTKSISLIILLEFIVLIVLGYIFANIIIIIMLNLAKIIFSSSLYIKINGIKIDFIHNFIYLLISILFIIILSFKYKNNIKNSSPNELLGENYDMVKNN